MAIIDTVSLYQFCDIMGDSFESRNLEKIYNYLWELSETSESGDFMMDKVVVNSMFKEATIDEVADEASFDSYAEYLADRMDEVLHTLMSHTPCNWIGGRWVQSESSDDMRAEFFDCCKWDPKAKVENEYGLDLSNVKTWLDYVMLNWKHYRATLNQDLLDKDESNPVVKLMALSDAEILESLADGPVTVDTSSKTNVAWRAARYDDPNESDDLWAYLGCEEDNILEDIKNWMPMDTMKEFFETNGYDAPLYDEWADECLKYASNRLPIIDDGSTDLDHILMETGY